MNDDPIVAEVRRIREALWQEAGCDLHRLGELARREAAKLPNLGPPITNAEQLIDYTNSSEEAAVAALNETPPTYGSSREKLDDSAGDCFAAELK